MKQRHWTEDEVLQIREKQLAKMSYGQIAKAHKTSRGSISGLMQRRGYSGTNPNLGPRFWTIERLAKLKGLLEAGLSYNDAAAEMCVSRRAASNQAVDRGWTKPNRVFIKRRQIFPPTPEAGPFVAPGPEAMVNWDQLMPHHCHWPVQDNPRLFCGATQKEGKFSYCSYHQLIGTAHN